MFPELCWSPAAAGKWEHVLVWSGSVQTGRCREQASPGHGELVESMSVFPFSGLQYELPVEDGAQQVRRLDTAISGNWKCYQIAQ